MILPPETDHECLTALSEYAAELVRNRDPDLLALTSRHATVESLADEITELPQRDDKGDPSDGPRLDACQPSQRLWLMNPRPNCFERTFRLIAGGEEIDPSRTYQAETVRLPVGYHTLPIVDGEPMILDPKTSRNAIDAARFLGRQRRNGSAPSAIAMTPGDAIDWIARIATEPAARIAGGPARVERAHRALRGLLRGRPLCMDAIGDVAFLLALADREARRWGAMGPRLVATAARAADRLDGEAARCWQARTAPGLDARNAPGLRIGGLTLRPDLELLGSIGRAGARVGSNAALEALRIKLATLGATPVLTLFERELNRDGRTLGPIAKPPAMIGSLGALTPEAIAGRWLAARL